MTLNAEAERFAAPQLAAKREYTKNMRALQSLRALSQNDNVCVASNHKDNIVAQIVANTAQGTVLGVNMK